MSSLPHTLTPWAQSDSAPTLVYRDNLGMIDFQSPVAKFHYAEDAAAVVKAMNSLRQDAPWCDCKVAFPIDDVDATWNAFGPGTGYSLPDGWELVETDASGARVVAIFRVAGVPSAEDGETVQRALAELDSGTSPRFLNHYHCDACDVEWSDEWSCASNDRCPTCDKEIEPHQSDDLDDAEEDSE